MPLKLRWPIPPIDNIPKSWALKSHLTMAFVGSGLKIWADWFNKFNVFNRETLHDALDNRPSNRPLVTVSNHTSCVDDPMIWACLRWDHLTRRNSLLRWSLAAADVMFTKSFYNSFSALGRGVPTERGGGVYQYAMDFAVGRLHAGRWVHVFPEGCMRWGQLLGLPLLRRESMTMRWVPTAAEIAFTKPTHSHFFAMGQSLPIVRGDGVYQRAMDVAMELMGNKQRAGWIHVFAEGKINMTGEMLRLKWGVGRLIAESKVPPLVIPMWHFGMDDVLPNQKPYIPRVGKKITLLIGEPMDFGPLLQNLKNNDAGPREIRKAITDVIQEEFVHLKDRAKALHFSTVTPKDYANADSDKNIVKKSTMTELPR